MNNFIEEFEYVKNSSTNPSQIYIVGNLRFSVLTSCLLRVEYQNQGIFNDKTTQSVINRSFDSPSFTVKNMDNSIVIKTEKVEFYYDINLRKMTSVVLDDGRKVTDLKKGNLKGTCRTLDQARGKRKLQEGILSFNGVAVLDDSNSLLIGEDGYIEKRNNKGSDIYYFAYGFEYKKAVKDFFYLTGFPPLIPRFALGNWWSRYKAYTQDEYTTLMQKFIDKKIPITVATIDMDWHWVDVIKRFGFDALDKKRKNLFELFYNISLPGWTGYSWNTELFPNPEGFLKWLKDKNLKVTMNLHPASGCKFYEDAYPAFCDFMGIDKDSKQQIYFDIADKKFIEGYFRFLHHPHEEMGVDFWWIDWQQGKNSGLENLDPLWALNHYHSIDISRNGKRPLILSRFAGAGCHRYPIGFSGDTIQGWSALDFQPYFTSTASNIGYTWWSHDIGGHCNGKRDDELYLRWVQFGVFSPIMRLHSTSNEFMGKEPWKYNKFVENTASDFMRLRHKLIPYLYTMNHLTASDGRPLIEPMYYENPRDIRAYKCPNEYYFGTELIVCPITEPCNKETGLAGTKVYLPKGRYTDVFTGRIYNGNTVTELFRDQSSIPVLAKEGAIIPMQKNCFTNEVSNPSEMEILICRGNNQFTLYEDDGNTMEYIHGKYSTTLYEVTEQGRKVSFKINPADGDLSLIPASRSYKLIFFDISDSESVTIKINDKSFVPEIKKENGAINIFINNVKSSDTVTAELENINIRTNPDRKELLTELISKVKGSNNSKALRYTAFIKKDYPTIIQPNLVKPITELDDLF